MASMKLYWRHLACFLMMSGCIWAQAAHTSSAAQGIHTNDMQRSCKVFVQEFYDWYVPKAVADRPSADESGNPWDLALKYRRPAFSPVLYRALKEDSDAQAKVEGYSVGIDFDPFLYTQNPEKRYVIGKATIAGTKCRVEVHGVKSGTANEVPTPVAELSFSNGHWLFTNFHYGKNELSEDEDLLSTLRMLKRDRQKK
jgi:hypothetical protein